MLWPLISIIVTSYNYGHTIKMALDSACCQDYPNLEILVLDNASIDDTKSVLEEYKEDVRIRNFLNPENIGAQANHNKGLALARGEYILFLSADDMLYPSSIRQAYLFFLAQPAIDLVYSPTHIMNAEGQLLYRIIITGEILGSYRGYRDEFPYLLMNNYVGFASVLVPRWVYEKYGGIDENIVALDYDLLLRWAAAGLRFGYLPQARHAYRIHDNQESGLNKFSVSGLNILERIALIRRYFLSEDASRFDGFEYRIARSLSEQFERYEHLGLKNAESIAQEVQRLQHDLGLVRNFNLQGSFVPKLTLLIIPYEPLSAFLESLQSLMAQSFQEWEAIVLSQPGIDLMPFCQHLDPHGRIRTLQLLNAMPLGRALNQGLRLASGNSITFLRAGLATLAQDHLQTVVDAFTRDSQAVWLAQARLILGNRRSGYLSSPDVYLQQNVAERICFSPCQPLEAVSFTRRMLDQVGYYHEDMPLWTEWDFLIRLSQYFPIHPLTSEVMIHVNPGAEPLEGEQVVYADTLERIYAHYPTESPAIVRCRTQYRSILAAMADFPQHHENLSAVTLEKFQHFMGAAISV